MADEIVKPIPAGPAIGLLEDGSINIGTPEQMKVKWDQWQKEKAETDELIRSLKGRKSF